MCVDASTYAVRQVQTCGQLIQFENPPDPSRSLLACRSQAEAESALWSLPSFAFCSTGAESLMRSLPSLALARREQRVLDLSELWDTFSFGLVCGILVCGKE